MHRGYASTSLGQIHYRRAGSGPPVLLIGQSGRSSQMHEPLLAALSRRYDVVAPDLPGTGGSAPLRPGATFEEIADGLLDAVAGLGLGPVNLYGIHTGNKIGAAMAARSPGSVERFVFAGQSHSIIPDQARRNHAIRQIVADSIAGDGEQRNPVLDWVQKISKAAAHAFASKTLDRITEQGSYSAALAQLVDDLQSMASLREIYRANFDYDLERDLRRLSVPTLVLEIATPGEDRLIGRQGPLLMEILSMGRIATIVEPDGHGNTLEHRADDVAAILDEFFGR